MTEKKRRILYTALELFAEQGYAATSTSKVAKAAGVSEGLIFRHFENKEGLLNAIMEMAKEKAYIEYAPSLSKTAPKEMIKGVLMIALNIKKEDYPLWKLIYALKWQTAVYDASMSEPVKIGLTKAFEQLGYSDPVAEAEAVMLIVDGLALAVLLRKPKNIESIVQSLLEKYDI